MNSVSDSETWYSFFRRWKVARFVNCQGQRELLFVLGTQKTGSTAIAALLASATRQTVTLDLIRAIRDPAWQLRVKNGGESFDSVVYRYRREFGRHIVKEPNLTYFAKELRQLYPRAKYVMIVRHPFDTIRSLLNRLHIPGNLSNLSVDRYPELIKVPAWQLAMDSTWLGRPSANYIEALAHRWDLATREYLTNSSQYTLVKYEEFLMDRKARIEKLAREVGMVVKHDIEKDVNIQYQHKGRSVDFDTFFGQVNLGCIRGICGESAHALKYTL